MRHETHCKLASYIYQKKCSSFADGPAWCVGKDMDRRKTRHGKLSGQNIVRDFCIAASYMAMAGWTSCEMTRRSWKWDRLPYFPLLLYSSRLQPAGWPLTICRRNLWWGKPLCFWFPCCSDLSYEDSLLWHIIYIPVSTHLPSYRIFLLITVR